MPRTLLVVLAAFSLSTVALAPGFAAEPEAVRPTAQPALKECVVEARLPFTTSVGGGMAFSGKTDLVVVLPPKSQLIMGGETVWESPLGANQFTACDRGHPDPFSDWTCKSVGRVCENFRRLGDPFADGSEAWGCEFNPHVVSKVDSYLKLTFHYKNSECLTPIVQDLSAWKQGPHNGLYVHMPNNNLPAAAEVVRELKDNKWVECQRNVPQIRWWTCSSGVICKEFALRDGRDPQFPSIGPMAWGCELSTPSKSVRLDARYTQ